MHQINSLLLNIQKCMILYEKSFLSYQHQILSNILLDTCKNQPLFLHSIIYHDICFQVMRFPNILFFLIKVKWLIFKL
jgi:hypothetical protein